MKAVVDRIVQYANRYQLTNVETGEVLGTFDFDEVTGTVQQVGTEIDAELFQSIADDLAARVKLSGGELKDTVVTFSDISGTAANVASGDTSATLWGKVKNWFSRLKALAFKDKINNADVAADAAIAQGKVNGLMTDYVASISASGRTVTYKNKNGVNMGTFTTQDTTYGIASQSSNGLMSSTDKTKLDGIESGAQKNTVLGVKGSSESAYRTGNVNITKANIGLGKVDNTSDEDKPISIATQTALNGKANTSGTYPNLTVGKATNADNATNATNATGAGRFIGTRIAENTDLNSLIPSSSNTVLHYYCDSITAAQTFENCPVEVPFNMIAFAPQTSGGRYSQILFAINMPEMIFSRYCNNNLWSRWRQYTTTDGTYPDMTAGTAEVANSVAVTLINSSNNINEMYGADYWGKEYYWGGGSTPKGAPAGLSSAHLSIQRAASGVTMQIIHSTGDDADSADDVALMRTYQNNTLHDWKYFVFSDGAYPTLGAGHLQDVQIVSNNSNPAGWYKFAEIRSTNTGTYSIGASFYVDGVTPDNTENIGERNTDGILNIEARCISDVWSVAVSFVAGYLSSNNFVTVPVTEGVDVYVNLPTLWWAYKITLLSKAVFSEVDYTVELTNTYYGTSAPSGAVYAVNRNVAAKGVTPATSSDSDDVATTEWVNDKLPRLYRHNISFTGRGAYLVYYRIALDGTVTINNAGNSNNYNWNITLDTTDSTPFTSISGIRSYFGRNVFLTLVQSILENSLSSFTPFSGLIDSSNDLKVQGYYISGDSSTGITIGNVNGTLSTITNFTDNVVEI